MNARAHMLWNHIGLAEPMLGAGIAGLVTDLLRAFGLVTPCSPSNPIEYLAHYLLRNNPQRPGGDASSAAPGTS